MQHPKLPEGFTPEIIRALNLRQFSVLCAQFGFHQIFQRLGWDDFLDYWQRETPDETFGGFLRRVGIKV